MRNQILTERTARTAADAYIASIPPYPGRFHGRGVVLVAGGAQYFPCAWVCIRMLRRAGCDLPIQLWHLGRHEVSPRMEDLVRSHGVTCVDAWEVRKIIPARILNGWEAKPYAILHSPFREVLLVDADNVAVADPTALFEAPPYRETGAVFWPDYLRLGPDRALWSLCGVPYRDEPEFESGQILVDKALCWRALCLAMWYNEHSDFFYRHLHGDKDTYHMAFRRLDQPYAMPSTPIRPLDATMCQHDFQGRRTFQHRNMDKWLYDGSNRRVEGFLFEDECRAYLAELRERWDGTAD